MAREAVRWMVTAPAAAHTSDINQSRPCLANCRRVFGSATTTATYPPRSELVIARASCRLLHPCRSGETSDDPSRYPDCNGVRRNVLADHGTGSDHASIADRDAGKHQNTRAKPYVVADAHRSGHGAPGRRAGGDICGRCPPVGCAEWVHRGDQLNGRADQDTTADRDRNIVDDDAGLLMANCSQRRAGR